MITDAKKFYTGAALLIGFILVLIVIFTPIFNGQNALNYMDSLYNSISKGSAYYIPQLKETAEQYRSVPFSATLELESVTQAEESAALFERGGATVVKAGKQLRIEGDLGAVLTVCLEDADDLFNNAGDELGERYGYTGRQALFNWWSALKELDKDFKRQSRFAEAAAAAKINQKAVECAYNYYGIEPWNISDKIWIITFSLAFYVVYTVWYGFAIMFLMEGWGFRLSH